MAERSALIIQNNTHEGPGTIGDVLNKKGFEKTIVDISLGQEIPPIDKFEIVFILGGPNSANDDTPEMKAELAVVRQCLETGKLFMGICLGKQILAKAAGGQVVQAPIREVGFTGPDSKPFKVRLTKDGRIDTLFDKLGDELPVFQLHGEMVIPSDSTIVLATGDFVETQIIKVGENAYGIQAHLELTSEMLKDWIENNPWLREQNIPQLKFEFAKIRAQYTLTAWQLISNFVPMLS